MPNEITLPANPGMVVWTPKEVLTQIQVIQQLMRDGMTEGEHWGKIPGCGDKPALLKPGAEKLGLMFRLAGKYDVQEVNLPNGHLDVKVKCALQHIVTGQFWGEGIGSCSTMESKYRYRSGVGENTNVQVPKNYWDIRRSKPQEAQELLGGKGYTTKKGEDGLWWIYEKIEKADNPDIADTYNTVRKIAKKRAFVDAMLSATAASDIFTQDIDEMFGVADTPAQTEKKEAIKTQDVIESQVYPFLSEEEEKEIRYQLKDKGIAMPVFKKALVEVFHVPSGGKIPFNLYPAIIEWIIKNQVEA